MPTESCEARPPGSTRVIARSRSGWHSELFSASGRSTARSRELGRRRVARLDPPVRAALRLGAYQLGYVDGVPRYAAVNESVELVRRAGLERAVAFANAVLDGCPTGSGRCSTHSPTRAPKKPLSCTRIPTGWPRRGGVSSGPTARVRSCGLRTSRRRRSCK